MKRISVIGGGASGILLTINLLNQSDELDIRIFEKDFDKFGLGIAYSTDEMYHLLNVRAIGMSLYPEKPDNFHNWLLCQGYDYEITDFVPRKIWGQYLRDQFYLACEKSKSKVNIIYDEVIDIDTENSEIVTTDFIYNYDSCVLSIGNMNPPKIKQLDDDIDGYFDNPWNKKLFEEINSNDKILIIGAGLTSVDILTYLKEKDHRGDIYIVSRSGNFPIHHQICEPYPSFWDELEGKDLNQMFSIVKKHLTSSEDRRSVIDSLRPHTQKIWNSFDLTDKKRFIRHLNQKWNIIRHRMPDSVYNIIREMDFYTFIGKVESIQNSVGKLDVTLNDGLILEVDKVINCTGPETNYNKVDMDLIKNLFNKNIIESTDIGISIKTDGYKIYENIFTLGPVLKGELFESTAIPEIRTQAKELSQILLEPIKTSGI